MPATTHTLERGAEEEVNAPQLASVSVGTSGYEMGSCNLLGHV